MTDLDAEPKCGFCEIRIDEDESLEPIFVGDPPSPRPNRYQKTARKSRVRGMDAGMVSGTLPRILGKEPSEIQALFKALDAAEELEFDTSKRVMTLKEIGSNEVQAAASLEKNQGLTRFEEEIDDDVSAATVEVSPPEYDPDPDAMLCSSCAEMIRNL